MAERKSSGGRGSRTSGAKDSRARATSKRTPTATEKELPSRRSPSGGDHDSGGMSPQVEEGQTDGKAMGRPPSEEPDVHLLVPEVHVGELNIDVKRLEAQLALRAQVANLVNLVAGVHVSVDEVKVDLKDVDAKAELKVRLQNTYNILDRTLTTLDENPQVAERVLQTADTAVQETGQIGEEATQPGGAVSELTSGVGDSLGNLTSSRGDTLSSVADKANPKKLLNGDPGEEKRTSRAGNGASSRSNASRAGRAAATAGVAGAAGLAAAALLDGRRGSLFRRRGPLQKLVDQAAGQLAGRRGKALR